MKKIFNAFIKRPVKNYNVENRAQAYVDKINKKSAPLHPTTAKQIENFRHENPDYLDELKKKDENLLSRLSGMVATPDKVKEITPRPSAGKTEVKLDFEYGYPEPNVVPQGKCTVKDAMKFISDHSSDTERYSSENIANDYKLDSTEVKKVLKYFHLLQIQTPKDPTRSELGTTNTSLSPIEKTQQILSSNLNNQEKK